MGIMGMGQSLPSFGFQPFVAQEEGEKRLAAVNTALICLRKKYPRGTEDV